jgi:type IV pilus assembly protein PilW
MTRRAPPTAAGFTLVELMIAMALGLVVVLVISQVFISSKQAYTTTQELSRLQEDARYGLGQMARVVRQAAYVSNPLDVSNLATIYPPAARALDGVDGAAGANDTLTVRFQGSSSCNPLPCAVGPPPAPPDGTVVDCLGNSIPAGYIAVNTYYVSATGTANGHASLWCDNTGSTGLQSGAASGPTELVPNVDDMQVLYGEDTDGDYVPNYYVPLGSVVNRDNVVAVRVSILFTSDDFVAVAPDLNVYNVLDQTFGPAGDRRLRRVYTTTITLRNRVQ